MLWTLYKSGPGGKHVVAGDLLDASFRDGTPSVESAVGAVYDRAYFVDSGKKHAVIDRAYRTTYSMDSLLRKREIYGHRSDNINRRAIK
jgi:hypothetical protein